MARVQDCRMAEVVIPWELPLVPHLGKVFCRTSLERRTLLHLLGDDRSQLASKIEVQPRLFFGRAFYLTRVELVPDGLRLAWHPPQYLPASGRYKFRLTHHGTEQTDEHTFQVPAHLSEAVVTGIPPRPMGSWEINVEDVLAFHAGIPTGTSVVR